MLLDCFNPSQMLWKPSYYLVRGSSLDLVLTTLVDLMVGSIRLGLVGTRGGGASGFEAIYRSHKSTEAFELKAAVVSSLLLDPQVYCSQRCLFQSTCKPITAYSRC